MMDNEQYPLLNLDELQDILGVQGFQSMMNTAAAHGNTYRKYYRFNANGYWRGEVCIQEKRPGHVGYTDGNGTINLCNMMALRVRLYKDSRYITSEEFYTVIAVFSMGNVNNLLINTQKKMVYLELMR